MLARTHDRKWECLAGWLKMCFYMDRVNLGGALTGAWLLQGEALLRDLLAIHVVAHLNEALCQNYRKICPASPTLTKQCNKVVITSSPAGPPRVLPPFSHSIVAPFWTFMPDRAVHLQHLVHWTAGRDSLFCGVFAARNELAADCRWKTSLMK